MPESIEKKPVKALSPEVARKIAAGEVIDRPNAIVRELMDNAVDSGASSVTVEVTSGGIEKIRVIDNGSGMSRDDLANCAHPHATSKISTEEDLLKLTTLGFRGEALSSMAAVSRLEIVSGGYRMNASVTEDHIITPVTPVNGTIVQTSGLFENFPARRLFLKRPASEALLCRSTFEEKVLPRTDIAFTLKIDGEEKLKLPKDQSLKQRFVETFEFFESEDLFYDIKSKDAQGQWSFDLIIGEPGVTRNNRKNIYIYINGRRIQEYSLVQAIEYGCQGYFPNGMHPVACLFVTMDPSLVDFNIHPAKKEARFKDIASLHHGVSTATKDFFKNYTIKDIINGDAQNVMDSVQLGFSELSASALGLESPKEEQKSSSFIQRYVPSNTVPTYNNVKRDTRSRFFSEITMESPSVEGHVTKPNYLPDSSLDSREYEDDKSFHFVGSTLGTFLIAEKDDILYIIDQHASHERMIYDEIMKKAGEKQNLIVPYTLQTSSVSEDNYLETIKDNLKEAGFTCRNVGNGRWEITTVPLRWKGSEADLQHDIIEKRINPKDIIYSIAAMTACKAAVKDGTVLDSKTAEYIARGALSLPDPHCPHGRPVYTTITRKQLFTLVKRI